MFFTSLRDAIEDYPDALTNSILRFTCKRDTDIVKFLRDKAALFDEMAKSRTYLYLKGNNTETIIDIVAYFSIAMQVLFIPNDMSIRQIKRLDGFSGKIHGERIKAVPVFLIGQLARNDVYVKYDIDGDTILRDAFSVIQKPWLF